MSALLPVLVVVHVALALALLLPAALLPLVLGTAPLVAQSARPGSVTRALVALQSRGAAPIGLGVLLTGLAMLGILGLELLGEPWLVVALAIYAVSLGVALFVQRPRLRRLVGLGGTGEVWSAQARRLRWVSYALAAAIGMIGFLMSTKPELW